MVSLNWILYFWICDLDFSNSWIIWLGFLSIQGSSAIVLLICLRRFHFLFLAGWCLVSIIEQILILIRFFTTIHRLQLFGSISSRLLVCLFKFKTIKIKRLNSFSIRKWKYIFISIFHVWEIGKQTLNLSLAVLMHCRIDVFIHCLLALAFACLGFVLVWEWSLYLSVSRCSSNFTHSSYILGSLIYIR